LGKGDGGFQAALDSPAGPRALPSSCRPTSTRTARPTSPVTSSSGKRGQPVAGQGDGTLRGPCQPAGAVVAWRSECRRFQQGRRTPTSVVGQQRVAQPQRPVRATATVRSWPPRTPVGGGRTNRRGRSATSTATARPTRHDGHRRRCGCSWATTTAPSWRRSARRSAMGPGRS